MVQHRINKLAEMSEEISGNASQKCKAMENIRDIMRQRRHNIHVQSTCNRTDNLEELK